MHIQLIKTGGLAGKKWTSAIDWEMTIEEWHQLIELIKTKPKEHPVKDTFRYSLKSGKQNYSIQPGLVPPAHDALFQKLFDLLKLKK